MEDVEMVYWETKHLSLYSFAKLFERQLIPVKVHCLGKC